MKIPENRVRKFLERMGYESKSKQPVEQLSRSLTVAVKNISDGYEPQDDNEAKFYKKLTEAVESEEAIEVVPNALKTVAEMSEGSPATVEAQESEVEMKRDTESSAVAVATKPKKKTVRKEKSAPTEVVKKRARNKDAEKQTRVKKAPKVKADVVRDKWGYKEGSFAFKINAVLSNKVSKMMKEIVEDAKVENTAYDHLKRMMEKGHVVKMEDGYRLAEKK